MRRGLPQLIVVAAVGLAFGIVYRYFLDEPSEASVANYLRSGVTRHIGRPCRLGRQSLLQSASQHMAENMAAPRRNP
jgi:hypothetical protein